MRVGVGEGNRTVNGKGRYERDGTGETGEGRGRRV